MRVEFDNGLSSATVDRVFSEETADVSISRMSDDHQNSTIEGMVTGAFTDTFLARTGSDKHHTDDCAAASDG